MSTEERKDNRAEREAWIREWFLKKNNEPASSTSEPFHEDYFNRFPRFKRIEKVFGAQPVPQATRDLQTLCESGVLERSRTGLGENWMPGFPKWVYSYTLTDREYERLKRDRAERERKERRDGDDS